MDIATRVYNHSFRLDPVVRSLLDTDFYKLLMLQVIWKYHRHVPVTFSLINRTKSVRLAEEINESELRDQLDHARSLRFTKKELIWLQGNTFYGTKTIFDPGFIEWLETFSLPEYDLRKEDGQYRLDFSSDWVGSTMWEIPALSIINELRARNAMKNMGKFELDVLYARAKAKLWNKVERLNLLNDGRLKVGDFGTRRRHGYLWQKWCCEALGEGIGSAFVGTSNVHIAMELGVESIGTNAHELPMVYAALAGDDDEAVKSSRYEVLETWRRCYPNKLEIILPDAYGTTSFLADAPEWVSGWTGARPDSKDPYEGTRELIDWWVSKGQDPKSKLVILSDGMDIDSIEGTYRQFSNEVNLSYGWGTNLTNDFKGCATKDISGLKSISLVCKVSEADGRPAVKLSDNISKATGPKSEVERYKRIFGVAGMSDHAVFV